MLLWLRDAVTTLGLLLRQAAVSLRYNWGIGILSVVLAVSLWVYVTDRQNPDQTGRVAGTLAVEVSNVPANQAVSSISPEGVTVTVRAPQNVFDGLTVDDFRATIDLAGATGSRVVVDVQVEAERARVDVVDISPVRVTVELENVTTRTVPVRAQLVGTPPRGFEAGAVTVEPAQAEVMGPESLVGRVDAVVTDVNLTGVSTNFQQSLLLEPRDDQGGKIEGVTAAPANARVTVEIRQLSFSAGFVVIPDIRGSPARGFRATGIEVSPPFVVISGPADIFQTLNPAEGVTTDAVSVDGASADVVRTVALQLPPGAEVEQPQITVRVIIEPVVSGTPTATPRP